MLMSWIFTIMIFISIIAAIFMNNGGALAGSVTQGAQSAITLIIAISGSICLWSGVGRVMEKTGISTGIARLLRPILTRLFPSTKKDSKLAGYLSNNICANLLGLGNAATPMGILASKRLAEFSSNGIASNELCRLIVLNTASIQLIPANVCAVRASLGANSPFEILPAVWITSVCSAGLGVTVAWIMGKVWKS